MTEFKDFLDQIKIRLTNPLIFSFLISWIIIHWQIFVGGFYLSAKDLEELGHNNFLDFVKKNIDWCNGFIHPLGWAIAYTILSPMIRLVIQWFNTWINKKGNEQIRKVAKEGFIQYEIYDTLLLEVQNQRKRNEEFTNEIMKLEQINDLNQKENIRIQEKHREADKNLKEERVKLNRITDISQIKGVWRVDIKGGQTNNRSEIIRIVDYSMEAMQIDGNFHLTYSISDFYYSPLNGYFFIRNIIETQSKKSEKNHFDYFSNLKEEQNGILVGRFNQEQSLKMFRISDTELESHKSKSRNELLLLLR